MNVLIYLLPMALGWGEGAEIRTPMAITVIGGLSFATLLTLIFIPVMYEAFDRKHYAADDVVVARAKTPVGADGTEGVTP